MAPGRLRDVRRTIRARNRKRVVGMAGRLWAKVTAVAASVMLAFALAPAIPAAQAADGYTSSFTATDTSTSTQYAITLSDFTTVGAIGAYILTVEADMGDAGWIALEGKQTVSSGSLNGVRVTDGNITGMVPTLPLRVKATPATSGGEVKSGYDPSYSTTVTLAVQQTDSGDSGSDSNSGSSGSSSDNSSGSASGSGDSSSGSGDSSSSSDAPKLTKPKITSFKVKPSVLGATVTVDYDRGTVDDGFGYATTAPQALVEFYRNGKLAYKTVDQYQESCTAYLKLRYAKKDSFYVKVFNAVGGKKTGTAAKSKTIRKKSAKVGKPTNVRATKISSKQAVVRWSFASGATGYAIYKGSKKFKTVKGNVTKYTVKGSGAGSAKYTIQALVKSKEEKKTFAGKKSKAAKPGKNEARFSVSTNPRDYSYRTCKFIVTKVSLSGSTYTVTGYAVNNRLFDMVKYRSLQINISTDGATVANKTLKGVRVNVKGGIDGHSKKMTFKIRGKAGADLRNGTCTRWTSADPVWNTEESDR